MTASNADYSDYALDELLEQRRDKDDTFMQPHYSPLTTAQRAKFDGLRYFEPNPALSFELTVRLLPAAEQTMQRIMTSANEIRHYQRWARLEFPVDGKIVGLTLYRDPAEDGFFLPFTDTTCGHETYGAGRYVEVETLAEPDEYGTGELRLRLDFNFAYNPYCAYNSRWSCPYVPNENHLGVAIRAGEMAPSDSWAGPYGRIKGSRHS